MGIAAVTLIHTHELTMNEGVPSHAFGHLRLTVAFGGVALIVAFWYWLMDSIGTF